MTIQMGVKRSQIRALKGDLDTISLSKSEKRLVLKRTAQAIKKNAQKNINQQSTPDGEKWKPRAKAIYDISRLKTKRDIQKAKKNGRMLKSRARWLNTQAVGVTSRRLFYKKERTGQISAIHQKGLLDTLPKPDEEKEQKEKDVQNLNNPATAKQAEKLKLLGYTAPKNPYKKKNVTRSKRDISAIQKKWRERILNGKNRRSTSLSEIQNTLTIGQAGALIRVLDPNFGKDKPKSAKKPLPERPFLDTNEERNAERMRQEILRVQQEKKNKP